MNPSAQPLRKRLLDALKSLVIFVVTYVVAAIVATPILHFCLTRLFDGFDAYQGRKLVLSGLNDPDSARFRETRIVKAKSGKAYCGEVNVKNSYGGYPGYSRFVVVYRNRQVILQEQFEFEENWTKYCGGK